MRIRTLEWKKDCLVIIDQTQLPHKQIYLELKDHYEVALALKEMKIRGALATVDYGTAWGVVRAAREKGLKIQVYATETRPLFQGARLTAWELMKEGIPVTLITDDMAGQLLLKGGTERDIKGAARTPG